MAFNFGAALGAAAKSGMETYMALDESERRKKELAMKEAEFKFQEEQRQQERKLNEITGQTLGMGDTRVTGADYTGVTGGIDTAEPTLRTEAYTPRQKMADFKQRALSAGIPVRKVTETAAAQRAEQYAEREEMALGFSQQVMDEIKANPNDLGAVFKKYFQGAYNEGKLPGLGDGKTAEVVPMGTGGQSVVLKDDKGKTVRTIPLTVDTIGTITKKWTDLMMADANPANYWKSREVDLKSREVGAKERELDEKIRVGLFQAQATQATAAAGASSAHAAVYQNMLKVANENRAAGEAMKPFIEDFKLLTPEEQAGSKGQNLLTQAATAAARKTGDVTGIINALKKPDAGEAIKVNPDGSVVKGGVLYVPDPNKPGDYKPAGGLGQSALDKAIAAKLQGGKTEPQQTTAVEGRPLYNKTTSELQRMANRPRGVSTAEANDAAEELRLRSGEARMSAIPSK